MQVRAAAAVEGAALRESQQRCAALSTALAAAEVEAETRAAGKHWPPVTNTSLPWLLCKSANHNSL